MKAREFIFWFAGYMENVESGKDLPAAMADKLRERFRQYIETAPTLDISPVAPEQLSENATFAELASSLIRHSDRMQED